MQRIQEKKKGVIYINILYMKLLAVVVVTIAITMAVVVGTASKELASDEVQLEQ